MSLKAPAANVSEKVRIVLTELRRRLQDIYADRLVKLVLYGSQARGDARPWSDIDVMVVLKGPVDPSRERSRTEAILGDLSLQHDVVILSVYVDEERFTRDASALLSNIRREGIAV